MTSTQSKPKKLYTGIVTSDAMDKTIVVKTERTSTHKSFTKTLRASKKYKVHDEKEIAKEGDVVEFYEGRPQSKTKYMYLARVVTTALPSIDKGV